MSKTAPVAIGNGLFANAGRRISLMDAYRELQASCPHLKHDPRGMCYSCGLIDASKRNEARLAELRALGAIGGAL